MTTHTAQILVFVVDGRRCGLPAPAVREIVRAVAVQPLPGAPKVVDGMCEVRGNIVPVISMRARLGLPPREVRSTDYFILAHFHDRQLALRVDDVLSLEPLRIEDAQAIAMEHPSMAGVATTQQSGIILVHEVDATLTEDERHALETRLSADRSGQGARAARKKPPRG